MWKRILILWSSVKRDAFLLWRALKHPECPTWLRWAVAGMLLYLVSPIRLIDTIPAFAVLDDMILIPFVMRWLIRKLPTKVLADIGHTAVA